MKCEKCGSDMRIINHERIMVEMDDDATEGQIADYEAAELSEDFGEWGATEITYMCIKCGNVLGVIED